MKKTAKKPCRFCLIAGNAFNNCFLLKYVQIPASVTSINGSAFEGAKASCRICSDTETSYAKTFADEKGITFNTCSDHADKASEIVPVFAAFFTRIQVLMNSIYFYKTILNSAK